MRALRELDTILSRKRNGVLLRDALEVEFKKNPVRFFRRFVMPLLPREARLSERQGPCRSIDARTGTAHGCSDWIRPSGCWCRFTKHRQRRSRKARATGTKIARI
jgi:hypothetical protein